MSTPLTSRRRSFNLLSRSDPKVVLHPLSRRSITGLTPVTLTGSPQLPDVRNEEDVREKREKRRSRTLAQATSSPHAQSSVEDNLGETAKLTNDQLATHYINCIKLSTENKITAKNAFNLHLIDHMNEMLKQRCEGTLNFQMAGGTIFASAKIYASRVDAVHSEAYKVLSSLGRETTGEKKNSGDEGEEVKEVGKKKKKRSKILESNPSALRLKKMDVIWQTDPLDQYYLSKFDVSSTSGLLVNHLGLCRDGITLRFDSDMESSLTHNICGTRKQPNPEDQETDREVGDLKLEIDGLFVDLENLVKNESAARTGICPALTSFSWTKTEEDSFEWQDDDEHAEPVEATIQNPVETEDMDALFDADDDMPELIVPDTDEAASQMLETVGSFPVTMDAELFTSFMPGEYSYFKPGAFSTWEGPNHWKMRMRPNRAEAGSTVSKNAASKDHATKGKKRKRNFYVDYPNVRVDNHDFQLSKKHTVITKRIQEKWTKSEEDRLLPAAGEFDVADIAKCVLQKNIQIRPVSLLNGPKQEFPKAPMDSDNLAAYNYDNPNDKNNYCPNMTDDEDDAGAMDDDISPSPDDFANFNGTELLEGFPDVTMSQTQNMHNYQLNVEAMLQGDHLISHPKKVEKISIAYAKKATRIDVRRLKAAMWSILHRNDVSAAVDSTLADSPAPPPHQSIVENGLEDPAEQRTAKEQNTFSDMYSTLPHLMPTTMTESLSIPLAFTCLLHLANEKSLKIEASPDMSDLSIMEPMLEN